MASTTPNFLVAASLVSAAPMRLILTFFCDLQRLLRRNIKASTAPAPGIRTFSSTASTPFYHASRQALCPHLLRVLFRRPARKIPSLKVPRKLLAILVLGTQPKIENLAFPESLQHNIGTFHSPLGFSESRYFPAYHIWKLRASGATRPDWAWARERAGNLGVLMASWLAAAR